MIEEYHLEQGDLKGQPTLALEVAKQRTPLTWPEEDTDRGPPVLAREREANNLREETYLRTVNPDDATKSSFRTAAVLLWWHFITEGKMFLT